MTIDKLRNHNTGIIPINTNAQKINELIDVVSSLEKNVADHETAIGGIITKIRMMWGRNALIDLIGKER